MRKTTQLELDEKWMGGYRHGVRDCVGDYECGLRLKEGTLEDLVDKAGYKLRSISWHSDGRVIAKTGKTAKNPKKIYSGKTVQEAMRKLLEDN